MQRPIPTRKRPAPGASPMVNQQTSAGNGMGLAPHSQDAQSYSNDQFMSNWADPAAMNAVPGYTDPPLYDPNVIASLQNGMSYTNGQRLPADQAANTQLVRRSNNHQLTSRDYGGYNPVAQNAWENEDDEDLEAQAMRARKEAQAKRKQIPPFVQKLSSFLDNSNHTTLIRWSDDGNSFIVLDEDEFAKTLIPELFKHNNYASFVRQLNMYGFHKKVGLSDNSMKQAERRDKKTPSEYFNKYFKRGRPELLWLIQKPKNPQSNSKRKRDDDKKHDSDDDTRKEADGGGEGSANDMQLISKGDYSTMRNEIRQLQQQQKLISGIIQQMRRQNEQWYQQASQFQKMHERHESSINAILTFLATFYNRSLEGQNGGVNMNLTDMFPSSMSQNGQNQGSVVDMGDFPDVDMASKKSPGPRPNKRPLALLPPPMTRDARSPSPLVATQSPESSHAGIGSRGHTRSQSFQPPQRQRQPRPRNLSTSPQTPAEHNFTSAAASPAVKSEKSPGVQLPDNTEDMMSVINSVNANSNTAATGPQLDFGAALSHFQTADGNTPLTQQQREDMLSLMNAATPAPDGEPKGGNNALINPQPPPMPTLEHFGAHQEQLDMLQRLQEEQAARVQNLSDRLAPISPGGSIPGMTSFPNYGNHPNAPSSDFDIGSFIHTDGDNYFTDTAPGATGTHDDHMASLPTDSDFNFDFGNVDNNMSFSPANPGHSLFDNDGASDGAENGGGRIVESISSSGPNSPAENGDKSGLSKPRSPRKKRKTG
ncbi:heat shock transcription factor [Diplodia corticola]|uniref:Heat shock transcription factor n=1 Tax=Diplodia corticola TaxID=236234 RepID=A0A1J9RC85_9PEZI|nr:heat shock transcription factor [Diplodia corticola]OJD30083.1 heat shock transcription factor [Diplodia corticola]